MGSKVWVSFSWITFQLLREETAKFYCTASSFHKIFNLVHDEVHDEVNLCTSKSCKVHKILRRTTFSWTCFEEYGLLRRTTFSSPTVTFFFCCLVTFVANFQLSWPDKNLRGRRGSGEGGGHVIYSYSLQCVSEIFNRAPPFRGYSFNISGLCLIKSDSLT